MPISARRTLANAVLIGLAMLAVGAIVLLNWASLGDAGDVLQTLPAAVAISAAVHVPQIVLAGCGWRALVPRLRPPVYVMALLRWYREAANALLPAGAIVGQTAAARLLARRGVGGSLAAATATVDLTIEAASQCLFTLAGLGLLVTSAHPSRLTGFAAVGIVALAAAAVAMIAVQRRLPLHWLAPVLRRLSRRWPSVNPDWIEGFQRTLLSLHAERRALAAAIVFQSTAWALGSAEIYLVLGLLGHPVTPADAVVVESLAQALRNVGFMLPGAFAVQEGAIVAASALVGVPATTALTAALVRRAREVAVGLTGLAAWWRAEAGGPRAAPLLNARTPT